jgi:hypothetical protein
MEPGVLSGFGVGARFSAIGNVKSTPFKNNNGFRENSSGLFVPIWAEHMINIITEVQLFFKRTATSVAEVFVSGHAFSLRYAAFYQRD